MVINNKSLFQLRTLFEFDSPFSFRAFFENVGGSERERRGRQKAALMNEELS